MYSFTIEISSFRFTVSFSSLFHAYYARISINRIYFTSDSRGKTVPLFFLFATVAWNACIRTHMHAFLSREAANRVTVTRLYRILIEKRDRGVGRPRWPRNVGHSIPKRETNYARGCK